MNRRQCEVCGRENILFFKCNYCDKTLCADHHLPEKHNCAYQPKVAPPYICPGVSLSKETLSELKKLEYAEKPTKSFSKKKKKILKISILVLTGLLLLIAGYVIFPMIDNTPPTISIVSPEEGAVFREALTVEAYANDSSGIETVEFEAGTTSTLMAFNNVTGHWTGRLDTRKLPDGINSIKVKAVDKAGNAAEKILAVTVDNTPPAITIISPETKIYDVDTVALTYTVNEPISWVDYSLNSTEKITLTGNTTLRNLGSGRYNLTVYANDTTGNMGFSRISFTVTNVFSSLDELVSFLREDDLSDVEWASYYTCVEFAEDFIERAEMKGYYCFVCYNLWENELDEYISAVESIEVVKNVPGGTEIRWYWIPRIGLGHAVVRTTVDGMDVIVDPQTDIILAMEDFSVLYEGEITQD